MRELLRQKRLEKKISPEDLAEAVGIKRRMYYYIEAGTYNPSWKTAQKLEQFFGIPASELLTKSSIPEKRKGEKESNANQGLQ